MEKDPVESKAAKTESGDPLPDYGETEVVRGSIGQRIFDSFRQNPNAKISHNSGADGSTFDAENAAENTANSPLERRLKGRHLQMIAIGGSIGMSVRQGRLLDIY